jgi:hypothetical protein
MQVTPTNALFSAISSQVQTIQQGSQNQTKGSGSADGSAAPRGVRIEKSDLETPHTVINASGQIETDGSQGNANLREAPLASGGTQAFVLPGSIIDITV